jgi:predicted metal-dependent enzyme (double-stranded beta helix superfamily)
MLLAPEMSLLHKLSEFPSDPTLQEAVPVLARLVREPTFLDSYVQPLVEQGERAKDWYVAHCYEDEDGSYSLQIFLWPPGSKTQVHDHSSWGAFCCMVGSLLEERYERLDHGLRPDHARLRMLWRRVWKREDGVSPLLPGEGGIHRVGNPTESKAISVHLYGPRTGGVEGRDYDPSRDHVCDRRESDVRTHRSPFTRANGGLQSSLPYGGEERGKEKRREAGRHNGHRTTLSHSI